MSWLEDLRGYSTIENGSGVASASRSIVRFVGATVTDDGTRTLVTLPQTPLQLSGFSIAAKPDTGAGTAQSLIIGTNQIVARGAGNVTTLAVGTNTLIGRTAGDLAALSDATAFVAAASETVSGRVELASAAEANALADLTRAVAPGRLPLASLTQAGLVELATGVEVATGTDATRAVCPATMSTHNGVCKAWARFLNTTIDDSFNVTSITDNGVGDWTVVWNVDFNSANYAVLSTAERTGGGAVYVMNIQTLATGTTQVISIDRATGSLADATKVHVAAFGDQ